MIFRDKRGNKALYPAKVMRVPKKQKQKQITKYDNQNCAQTY